VKVGTYSKQAKIQIKLADNGHPRVRTTKMININVDIKFFIYVKEKKMEKPLTIIFIEGIFFM
jgi:hypothetical protein